VKSVRQVAAKGLQQYCNMPAQTLGLKLTWYACSPMARGLSHFQKWLLWTLNTISRVKLASPLHRLLCKNDFIRSMSMS
jgi:hypothetical protein